MTDQRDRARVARYDLVDVTRCGEGWREMQRDDDYGEWVTYEDYAAALADAERRVREEAAKMAEEKAERSLRGGHLNIPEYNFGYRGGLRGLADEIRSKLYAKTQAQAGQAREAKE